MNNERKCPECGQLSLEWDEADVGIGVITGPAWCTNPDCGWAEERFDAAEEQFDDTGDFDIDR